jgi:hypothetical protein
MYNLTDEQMRNMTGKQAKVWFMIAEERKELEQFSDWFWSKLAELNTIECECNQLQRAVYFLEDYKRALGRQYNKTNKLSIGYKYNMLENTIRCLCQNFKLKRKYDDYYLKMC